MAPIPSISRAKDKEEVEGKESQPQSPYNTHTKCLVTLSRTSFIIKSVQHKGLQHGPKHIYTVDWRSFPLYFSDVNILGESERERLFCKKLAKVRELVDAMHEKIVPKGVYVIREGIFHPSLHYSYFHCHYY